MISIIIIDRDDAVSFQRRRRFWLACLALFVYVLTDPHG